MEQYVLYLVLKEIVKELSGLFEYSYNDMDSNKDNVIGIYIKGGEPSEYRTIKNGQYYNIINRVQFLIQGGLDNDSLMSCLELGSKIKYAFITTNNVFITAPSKVGINENGEIKTTVDGITMVDKDGNSLQPVQVVISKTDMMSDLVPLGKSEQGRPRYSINFKIKYKLGGN